MKEAVEKCFKKTIMKSALLIPLLFALLCCCNSLNICLNEENSCKYVVKKGAVVKSWTKEARRTINQATTKLNFEIELGSGEPIFDDFTLEQIGSKKVNISTKIYGKNNHKSSARVEFPRSFSNSLCLTTFF